MSWHVARTVSSLVAVLRLSGGGKFDAVQEETCSSGHQGAAYKHLHVPFRAVALQQLANAILISKKVSTFAAVPAVPAAAAAAAAVPAAVLCTNIAVSTSW